MPTKKKNGLHKPSFFIFAYWHDPNWDKFVGATVKIWDLTQNIAALGHEVVLFLPRYNFPQKDLPFKLVQIPLLNIPMLRYLSFNFNLAVALFISSKKDKPDVVYVRRGISLIPALFSKIKKSIFVYEVNDDPFRRAQNPGNKIIPELRFQMSRRRDELSLKLCDIGLVITKEIKKKILQKIPILSERKLLVIPSGSNISLFKPLSNKCLSKIGLESSKTYVCFVGSLLKYQGVDILIEAAPYIINKLPACTFLIIGEGPEKDTLIQKVHKKRLQDSILFCGQVKYEDLPRYIGASAVCVAPFTKAVGLSSPAKMFDYLACGKPVVASFVAGTTDIFGKSGAVTLLPPSDPKALAEAVIEILANREMARSFGEKGRKFIEKNYDRLDLARKIVKKARNSLQYKIY